MKGLEKGDIVNAKSRNPRLQGGEVLGRVWVHMGAAGEDVGRWMLVKFPRVEDPCVIPAVLLEIAT